MYVRITIVTIKAVLFQVLQLAKTYVPLFIAVYSKYIFVRIINRYSKGKALCNS